MMDTLLEILKTSLGTMLAVVGVAIVFFSFFEYSKGSVKMRKRPKDGLLPAAIGAVLIISGFFLNGSQLAPATEPTVSPMASAEVTFILPTSTAISSTNTALPTETLVIPTETASPIPVKTLTDGCIAVQTWQIDSTDVEALDSTLNEDNCWNLESLGFFAEEGTLHVTPKSPKVPVVASGIYTAISNRSTIEFKIYVSSMYLVHSGAPAYITFSIAPQGAPMTRQESGRFKLQVKDTGDSPIIFFMLADTGESNGNPLGTRHYEYRNTYDVRIELQGISMKVYINNIDTEETVSIPSGPKVFYIGYSLPLLAGLEVDIKDLIIDGVKK